jgi:beta-glucanase (GH16 family)
VISGEEYTKPTGSTASLALPSIGRLSCRKFSERGVTAMRFSQGREALRHKLLAGIGTTVLLGSGLAAGQATAAAPSPPAGWTTVWTDDFNGSGALSSQWVYRVGTQIPGGPANFGTGEVESNTNGTANVVQSGGNLRITALRDAAGAWTSGRVETSRDNFQPPPGGVLAVEARLQLPNVTGAAGLGYWPAFWFLGTPYRGNLWNWPGVGEIDIMENVQGINTLWGTMHCGTSPGGECNEKDGRSANTPGGSPSLQAGMHTFRMEWDESVSPQQIRWYLDGRLYHSVSQNQISAATWSAAFDHGYYLILNLAIGGEFPAKMGGGPTAATASGGALVVDYVTVRTRAGSGGGTPPPTTPPSTPPSTPPPPPPGGGIPAQSTFQAEAYSAQSGAVVEPTIDTGGGSDVGYLANGDWLRFDNVDFGTTPLRTFSARAASGIAGGGSGLVEVRLDGPGNPVVSSFAIANTGGWQTWRTVPSNINYVTGRHQVYLTFTSGQPADFVNVNWFTFS